MLRLVAYTTYEIGIGHLQGFLLEPFNYMLRSVASATILNCGPFHIRLRFEEIKFIRNEDISFKLASDHHQRYNCFWYDLQKGGSRISSVVKITK